MADKELLETVARAIGLDLENDTISLVYHDDCGFEWWDKTIKSNRCSWGPLTSDGDAFRLAVGCGVLGSAEVRHHKALLCLSSDYDKLELERRAIVLAVAEAQQSKGSQ